MLKYRLLILLAGFAFQYAYGQDIINTKSGQQLNADITEQTDKVVKYRMSDYEDGPVLWMKLSRIDSIEYKNGFTDLLGYQNPRKQKPFGVNLGGALAPAVRSGFVSSSLDYFISPQVDLEVSIGTSDITSAGFYFSAGSRFHLNSKYSEKRLTPFTGLLFGSNYGDEFCQVPAGINWLSEKGINVSLSLNEMIGFSLWHVTFLEIRAGWRFRL
jgi:hypothetical protein